MQLVKIVFRSVDDLLSFIRDNSLTRYEVHPASLRIITEYKAYVLPLGSTMATLSEEEQVVSSLNNPVHLYPLSAQVANSE